MEDLIGYDEIIENSMRSVIYETLKKIEKSGLIGKHYFVITFMTRFPGVNIAQKLMDKYSEEMTIAIQYQYENLVVERDHFQVSLSFDGKLEKLVVPYKSVTSFSDPSMNFGLKFSVSHEDFESSEDEIQPANKSQTVAQKAKEIDLSAKVISLDAFRDNPKKDS